MAPTPVEVVEKLLSNTSNPSIVEELTAPDATYVSLAYDNPDLKKILPYAGTHTNEGPKAIIETFAHVAKIWANEEFTVQALFGTGENVAVFGSFTYRSRTFGRAYQSPFSIWCKVNEEGKVTYMQFMEDTLGTTGVFKVGGSGSYGKFRVEPDTNADIDV